MEEATAEVVQATYTQLFAEHGPPLVMKSDNGGPFQADSTKRLLAAAAVTALFNPRRRPGSGAAPRQPSYGIGGLRSQSSSAPTSWLL